VTFPIIIAAVSEVIALWCAVGLWRSRASGWQKLFWSLVLLIPVVGPMFYGGMFELPSVQSEAFRSTNEWDGPHSHDGPDD
jgi:NO-binding membrane sensor protein with MHYT domain